LPANFASLRPGRRINYHEDTKWNDRAVVRSGERERERERDGGGEGTGEREIAN